MRSKRYLLFPVVGMILAWTSHVALGETTLRAVTFLPGTSAFMSPFETLAEQINAIDGGPEIEIVGGPEAVPPFELGNAIAIGAVDIGVLPVNYYRALAIEAEVLQLLPDPYHELRQTEAWPAIEAVHHEAGLELLGVYGDSVPFYTYLVSPVAALDFGGLRMRVTPVYSAFYESLGATVVNLPPLEIHGALNAGAIDGFGWPAWDVTTFGWDEFVRYRLEPGFYRTAIAVVMNRSRWKSLSESEQRAIDETIAAFERRVSDEMEARNHQELSLQDKAGIMPIDMGAELSQRANSAYWDYLEAQSPELIGWLRQEFGPD